MSDPIPPRLSPEVAESLIEDWESQERAYRAKSGSVTSVASVAPWPNPLAEEAYHGLAGEVVHTVDPHTEADPAAVLMQFLVAFGNVVGPSPYFRAEADRHATNLYAVVVGRTSKGRKGSSWGHVRTLFEKLDPEWAGTRVQSGLSSGEGLIWAVRDQIERQEPVKQKGRVVDYETVLTDPGVSDKRLLVLETEFGSTLRVLRRDGNTLSPAMRQAWDTGNLRVLNKNSPVQATGAVVSIIAHITQGELLRYLDGTEAGSGFANRFLWTCARRSKVLPEGGRISEAELDGLRYRLREAVTFARGVAEMKRDEIARAVWRVVYPVLSEGKLGLLGAVTSRAEAQVMRLACIYALVDRSQVVRAPHLLAALAVWEYCEASARFVFGDALGHPVADRILRELRAIYPEGLDRTAIRDLFDRHLKAEDADRALGLLLEHGLARCERVATGGRPLERWHALVECDKSDGSDGSEGLGGVTSHMSLLSQAKAAVIAAKPRATSDDDAELRRGVMREWDLEPSGGEAAS